MGRFRENEQKARLQQYLKIVETGGKHKSTAQQSLEAQWQRVKRFMTSKYPHQKAWALTKYDKIFRVLVRGGEKLRLDREVRNMKERAIMLKKMQGRKQIPLGAFK